MPASHSFHLSRHCQALGGQREFMPIFGREIFEDSNPLRSSQCQPEKFFSCCGIAKVSRSLQHGKPPNSGSHDAEKAVAQAMQVMFGHLAEGGVVARAWWYELL